MVQDVFDPELYLALFDAKHPVTDTTVSSAHTYACHVPYSGKFSEGEIFGNFRKKQ